MCAIYGIHRYNYIEHQSRRDYIIHENVWSSSSCTSQRMKLATSKVFLYASKVICTMANFHASEELCGGSEFSCNYTINYLIITL